MTFEQFKVVIEGMLYKARCEYAPRFVFCDVNYGADYFLAVQYVTKIKLFSIASRTLHKITSYRSISK